MRKSLLCLLLAFLLLYLSRPVKADLMPDYVGGNPFSLLMSLPLKDEIRRFGPILAGNEYGVNFVAGYRLSQKQLLEARLAFGPVHQVANVLQVHFGAQHFFQKEEKALPHGLYSGISVKYWDFYNRLTQVHFHNLSPYITAGYAFPINEKIRFDLRLNQTVAVFSWSSLEHTGAGADWFLSPWPEFIPVLPTLSLTISWNLKD